MFCKNIKANSNLYLKKSDALILWNGNRSVKISAFREAFRGKSLKNLASLGYTWNLKFSLKSMTSLRVMTFRVPETRHYKVCTGGPFSPFENSFSPSPLFRTSLSIPSRFKNLLVQRKFMIYRCYTIPWTYHRYLHTVSKSFHFQCIFSSLVLIN